MAYIGFEKLKASLKGAKNPGAVAASIGRKKYGKEKFQKAAAKGEKMRNMHPQDAASMDEYVKKRKKRGH